MLVAQMMSVDVIFNGFTRWLHDVLIANDYFLPGMSFGTCGSSAEAIRNISLEFSDTFLIIFTEKS